MKARYKVDLPQQLAICEVNYSRLMKLTPDLESRQEWEFAVNVDNHSVQIYLTVSERAKYTTTIEVRQYSQLSEWAQPPELLVRLYHDACMAEVIAWEKHRRIKARYNYPNRHMYQSDEKAQMNIFLGEWLSYCLEQGRVTKDLVTLGLTG